MRLVALVMIAACAGAKAPQSTTPAKFPIPARTPGPHAEKVKVTILSTMLAGSTDVIGEWGFAALVEVDGKRILVDTGLKPETVLVNAQAMGIDLASVTDVVLTHAHTDHTGGLITLRRELMKRDATALGRAHVGTDFFAVRIRKGEPDDQRGLRAEYEGLGGVWVEHDKPIELVPGAWMTGPVPRPNDEKNWGKLGRVRKNDGELVEDTVPEDSSIVIDMPEGLLIVAGCGHAGIVNISEYARKIRGGAPVHAVVGGLHLFSQPDEQLKWTGKRLRELGVAVLLGVHCTGIEAVFRLREALGLERTAAAVGAVGASFTRGSGIDATALAH